MSEPLFMSWEHAERGARTLIALSGAGVVVWALVRWPLAVLLKAAALAAFRSALRDEDARASLARLVREQLIKPDADRLTSGTETLGQLEQRVARLEGQRPPGSRTSHRSSRRSA